MPIRVLFLQSQAFFGPDVLMHAQIMRGFDPREVEVHVACTTERTSDPAICAYDHIKGIPGIHFRDTDFGPTISNVAARDRLGQLARGPAALLSLLKLAWYIRRNHIDVIHGTEKPRDAFYGVLLSKLTGAASVVHMHVAFGEWQSRALKWALRHADAIAGVSNFTADSIVEAGYPRDRVFAVHNSLDLEGWDPRTDGQAVRRELGLAQDAPVLGIVSRLYRWKGHEYLFDSLALVKKEVPDVQLVVVGQDDPRATPGEGSFRASLEARAERLGITENVLFTGFRPDIPALMAAFDVFVHPSWEEPFGLVFLEAMAMEKPVVAWRSGGAQEVVENERTGLLVERGSVPGLAAAITRLLADATLRRAMGVAGRARARDSFSPAQMCATTLELYRSVLRRRRTQPAR